MSALFALIVLLPLVAAAMLALLGGRMRGRTPGQFATATAAACFLLSLVALFRLLALPEEGRALRVPIYTWIDSIGLARPLHVEAALLLDPLSITWALVISGVGSLIFLYSIAYMEGERGYARYFAFLCLFLFSMLVLVLGENLALAFVGWEGVGLCSYLLIGFEYGKEVAADAGRKAFVVNRIGDVGFLLAMFGTWKTFGTLDFVALRDALASASPALLAAVPLLALGYFVGATGKSAQIPLFVWLPDAMAGPTPVSALIHAATMVTAGVYLLCRLSALFVLAPAVLELVAWIGGATALLAALIALRQRDVKRVLAYSTVSQLGYMFLACGVGAFGSAAFHVVTHAFFKAALFLGAGAVIHALHGEQDLWRMGGLKHALPRTYKAMLFGAYALAGIPIFAGFFSKDEILGAAFSRGMAGHASSFVLWGLGVATAALTAFYSARLITLCFEGESRLDPKFTKEHGHPHEAPPPMAFALTILKWLSLAGGALLGIEVFHWEPLHRWLEPSLAEPAAHAGGAALPWLLLLLAAGIAVLSWRLASRAYRGDFALPRELELASPRLARALVDRFWVDEIYQALFVRPLRALAELCARFDDLVIDGFFRALGSLAAFLATCVRLLQTGVVHAYAFWFLAGAALLLWLALHG